MRIVFALLGLLQVCAATGDMSSHDAVPAAPVGFGDSSRFRIRPDILTPAELHRLTPAHYKEHEAKQRSFDPTP